MKNIAFCLALFAAACTLPGCHVGCLDGHGPVHVRTFDAGDFTGIHLNLDAEVTVTRGPAHSVEVEAEDNLLNVIEAGVKGRSLRLESERCLDPSIGIKVRVTLPSLEELAINGSGDIVVPDTFQVEKLKLTINGSGNLRARLIAADLRAAIHGSGDVELAGSANRFEVKIAGSGDVQATDMPCNSVEVNVLGSGSVYVYAIQDLEIKVNGSGDVHYKGKPALTARVNGSGKVVDAN
jgi:hypothetical protein